MTGTASRGAEMRATSNAAVLRGEATGPVPDAYRALREHHSDAELCRAYALYPGSHWTEIVKQAVAWGDIDRETGALT